MTSISWWRSWHGAPTDHKWSVVAARSGVKVGIVSAVVWALLDHASQNSDRGSIAGFDTETYAVYSGFDETEVAAVIQAMTDKGIILDGRFTAWEKRQPKREDNSSERVRKWREMQRNVTHGNTPDKDKDTDTDVTETEKVVVVVEEGEEQPIPYIQPAPTTTSPAFHYGNSPFGSHTPQLCEKLYKLTTGQPSIPNDILGRALPDLETILDHYQQDPAKAAPVGKQVFARWCNTTGKSGRRYSTTNPGWLTWWLEELAPRPLDREQDPGKMSDADYLAYKLAQAKELGIT